MCCRVLPRCWRETRSSSYCSRLASFFKVLHEFCSPYSPFTSSRLVISTSRLEFQVVLFCLLSDICTARVWGVDTCCMSMGGGREWDLLSFSIGDGLSGLQRMCLYKYETAWMSLICLLSDLQISFYFFVTAEFIAFEAKLWKCLFGPNHSSFKVMLCDRCRLFMVNIFPSKSDIV